MYLSSDKEYYLQQDPDYDHCYFSADTSPKYLQEIYEKMADGWQIDDLRARVPGGRGGPLYIEVRFRRKRKEEEKV